MAIVSAGHIPALSLEVLSALPARTAIVRARGIGFSAVGLPGYRRDFAPQELKESGARDLSAYLAKTGLGVSWISAGRKGRFTISTALDEDVTQVRVFLDFAAKIRAEAVIAGVGRIGKADSAAAANLRQAMTYLANVADATGVALALAVPAEEYALCSTAIAEFAAARVGMLLDPGALLFAGIDPVSIAGSGGYVAVRTSDASGEEADLALGEGRVDWRGLLAALGARGYHGYATIEFAPKPGDAAARAARALESLGKFANR